MAKVTVFLQDGFMWAALSHSMPPKELARETAKLIRDAAKIPRSSMEVQEVESVRKAEWRKPTKE